MRVIIFDFGSVYNSLKVCLGAPQLWLSSLEWLNWKEAFITDDATDSISETLRWRRPKMMYSNCQK
jgi:hypothetical protein